VSVPTPMGTLLNYLQQRTHIASVTGSPPCAHEAALLAAVKTYQDKLTLVHFQSARVARACKAVKHRWKNLPMPPAHEEFEGFIELRTQLRYDLCFEFVALRIAYDALARIIVRVLPTRVQGKAPENSFKDLLVWLEDHGKQQGAPSEVVDAVCGRKDSFLQLRYLRDEFVHRDDDTLIVRMRDGEIGFELTGDRYPWIPLENRADQNVHPLKPTLRHIIIDHLELAFEVESLTLAGQPQPVRVPGSITMLPAELSELYDLDRINTYRVEEFHTQPPSV